MSDIDAWQSRLVRQFLRLGALAALLPLTLALGAALGGGNPEPAAAIAVATLLMAALAGTPRLGDRTRAIGLLGSLAALGLSLLAVTGAVAHVYLVTVPVLAAMLCHGVAAGCALVLTTLALVGVGIGLQLPPALQGHGGLPHWQQWLVVGAGYAFVAGLLSGLTRFLVAHFQASLQRHHASVRALQDSQATLRDVAAQVPGMVYRLLVRPDGSVQYLYVSPGARELLGIEADALLADPSLLPGKRHPDDRARVQHLTSLAYARGEEVDLEYRQLLPDGSVRWVRAMSTPVGQDAGGQLRSGIMQNITARKEAEAHMWRQAHFDALTALPNRVLLRDRVEQAMRQHARDRSTVVLMLIDLDNFKEVNDSLGHDLGDRLLVQAASRIQQLLRGTDTVARMGGDEFVVVLPGFAAHDRIGLLAQQMIDTLSAPFHIDGHVAHVSASIGITLFPEDAGSLDGLLKNADLALYQAKGAGRRTFRFCTARLQDEARHRVRLAADLRRALDLGQLHLAYQPIVELATGRVSKAEALLRWTHPELGPVSPAEFVPLAESTGLIDRIGDWVLRTAALQARQWREQLDPQFRIGVNRSPEQFRADSNGADWVRALRELGVPGRAIAVEITEGLLLDATPTVRQALMDMREAGMVVALDDFGTGHSALSYLQRLDIDVLKIDRSFVNGLLETPAASMPLCRAMIRMAHELGMSVIAEGVETAEQAEWLRDNGCDHAQGYHYARPMPADALAAWVHERAAAATAPLPSRALVPA